MNYYSTRDKTNTASLKEAVIQGLASDKGLYMPNRFPLLSGSELEEISKLEYHQIAHLILNKYLEEEIDSRQLAKLTEDAYNFTIPLEQVIDRKYVKREGQTFHPTDLGKEVNRLLLAKFSDIISFIQIV